MEHDEAIRSEAAEHYVARELSPPERKAFEEHFFTCEECADDVRFELAFAANVRAASRERRAAPRFLPRPSMALSFAANLALAAGLGYVLSTRPHEAARPRLVTAYFAPGPTKGADSVHTIAAGETIYQVRFGVPDRGSPSYTYAYEILDAAGKREASGSLKAPPGAEDSLNLQIPVESLPAGVHTLVVRGESGGEIVSWSRFRLATRGGAR